MGGTVSSWLLLSVLFFSFLPEKKEPESLMLGCHLPILIQFHSVVLNLIQFISVTSILKNSKTTLWVHLTSH